MRHSANRQLIFGLLLLLAVPGWAGPVIHDIDIVAELMDNGDCYITEKRTMTIDAEGTEGYIIIDNLFGSTVSDFSVTDETGLKYRIDTPWNVKRSRQQKEGRCGIVHKYDGVELCWGLGQSGRRVYTISYKISELARSYSEADGFNWQFIAEDLTPSPQHAKVTIVFPEQANVDYDDALRVWSFGYEGDVHNISGEVVAETDRPMVPEGSMTVMVEVKKGVLHPSRTGNGTFEQVKKEAFEGSDYDTKTSTWEKVKEGAKNAVGYLMILFIIVTPIVVSIRKKREFKRVTKDLNWYRDIPLRGNLVSANAVMNAYKVKQAKTDHLITAMVLRLLRTKTLRIEKHFIEATGLRKLTGGSGKDMDCIVLGDFDENNNLINTASMRKLYDIFVSAAGEDRILQPKELKHWMVRHTTEIESFLKLLNKKTTMKECRNNINQVRQLFGFKKFLEDFTLANERHVSELSLWNDYLVYAELFGIADQVRRDMEKINPEYLNMDEIARVMNNKTVVPLLTSATLFGTNHATRVSRSSGGGGRSSFGGGGGHGGGGHGGGVR